jgi:hypothetical protein
MTNIELTMLYLLAFLISMQFFSAAFIISLISHAIFNYGHPHDVCHLYDLFISDVPNLY